MLQISINLAYVSGIIVASSALVTAYFVGKTKLLKADPAQRNKRKK